MATEVRSKNRQQVDAHGAPQSAVTIESLPDEVLHIICLYAGAKTCTCLAFVSKRFYVVAFDEFLWRVFCQSLGYPATEILSQKGINCCRDYLKMRELPNNLRHSRFITASTDSRNLDRWPELSASADDLCYFYYNNYGEIRNVWTKELEFRVKPEAHLSPFFKEMGELAARGIALIDSNENNESTQFELEEVIQTLKEKIDKRFLDFTPWVASLSSSELSQTRRSLQKIQDICRHLSAIYADLFQQNEIEVQKLAANRALCAASYRRGIIDIWDRHTKIKLASILNNYERVCIDFLQNCVCVFSKDSHKLLFYDLEKGPILNSGLQNVHAFQTLNDHELLTLSGSVFTISNYQTQYSERLGTFRRPISDLAFAHSDHNISLLAFEKQTGQLAIAHSDHNISLVQLTKSEYDGTFTENMKSSLTNVMTFAFPPFVSMEWRGDLYVTSIDASITKIKMLDNKSVDRQPFLITPQGEGFGRGVELIWEGDKFHVRSFVDLQNNPPVHFRKSYNFFVTQSQVVADLADGYRNDAEVHFLDTRFFNLSSDLQERIFSYLPTSLTARADSWHEATSEMKAQALGLYLADRRFNL